MKRHIALKPLSWEHHHGLVHARRLVRSSKAKEDAAQAVEAFLRFVEEDLRKHFRVEEEFLLPMYALHARADEKLIGKVLTEHVQIRAAILTLEQARLAGDPAEEIVQRLGKLLEGHIRLEERRLFPAVEAALSLEELMRLGTVLSAGWSSR
ncbi:MAG: hemerythrin domain-containing protein [Chthonomonadales bacterium]